MIQKMSDQGRIKFTEKNETKNIETPKQDSPERDSFEDTANSQKSRKIENEKVINSIRSANSILSAGGGTIKNDGGPRKYIGSETQNSIWDSSIVEKLSSVKTNKEKTLEEKEHIQKVRKGMRQEALDELSEALKNIDTRKDASIKEIEGSFSTNYKMPKNNLSIFDTKIFDDMPEKTAGEEMSEKVRKPKDKDDSWKENRGTVKPSDFINKVFKNLMKSEK